MNDPAHDPAHSPTASGEASDSCPDENELVGFLEGALSPTAGARLESHCAGCERCREALGVAAMVLVRSGSISSAGAAPALRREITSAVRGLLADASRAGTDALIGQRIGRFEILALIDRGRFGTVYRARDTELGRMVAVKWMRRGGRSGLRDPEAVEALLRAEAAAVARLKHPNVVTLYDYGMFEGTPYLILELLEGESLRSRIARGARIAPREALAIAAEVTRGLLAAHVDGVIHRDIKPGNVFVCTGGPIKILDFGLARLIDPVEHRNEAPAAPAGTPRYMAPELFAGHPADACSDVYAVGVTLLDILTSGASGPDRATLAERIDRAAVSPRLRRLLRAATAPRREDRIPTAEALLAELSRAQRDLVLRVRMRRLGLALAAAVVAAVAAVVSRSGPQVPRIAAGSGGSELASRNPCHGVAHHNNGQYCGRSTQAGFDARQAVPNIVYECYDGQLASQTRCPADCVVAEAGSADSCIASDPCVHVPAYGNGPYCGSSTERGFGGDVRRGRDLVTCRNGTMVDGTRCGTSCTVEPTGTADRCDPDPCAGVSHDDNGAYCGVSTRSGFDRQNGSLLVLYTCTDGRTASAVFCQNGCTPGASGAPDHCN